MPTDGHHGAQASAAPPSSGCILAARAAQGERGAFEQLVAPYRPRLLGLLRGMVPSAADAEETLQQALLNMFVALPRLTAPANDRALSAWIFRVTVNTALMHLRAHRRRPTLHLEDMPPHTSENAFGGGRAGPHREAQPDEHLVGREMAEHVQRAVGALPDKYRLVLWLRDIEEQTNDEVAHTLGLTVPTVKARLLRARHAVRHALSAYVDKN
jgi:RNA polymerase sigma-70 factor (ECF subfamily)